jgi:hypothetical protein
MEDNDGTEAEAGADLTPGEYCRQIEAYLCRKNDGHLIRIVGPAFEQVTAWAVQGIPLKVAFRGIDRYADRYYGKGPRRWPVRIEFCQSDVLDVFDEWRRAVGVGAAMAADDASLRAGADTDAGARSRRGPSLSAHLDRVLMRFSSLLAGRDLPDRLRDAIDRAVGDVDAVRASSRGARGAARRVALDELARIDRELIDAVLRALPDDALAAARAEADGQLAPFKGRMTSDAYAESLAAAMGRVARERLGLPRVALE